jgi:type II secretory pathway pseudopilin PulG
MNEQSKRLYGAARARTEGFTLVEATLSVAIVGILVAASAGTFGAIARAGRQQTERQQGYMLAQQLMSEILQTCFTDPSSNPPSGPTNGGPRTYYNGVMDYNNFSETTPTLRDGTVLRDYTGWNRVVAVVSVDPSAPANGLANSSLVRIRAAVTSPSGKKYVLVGLRSKFGEYETAPMQQTNLVTGVSIGVQSASSGKSIYTNSHPLNVSSSQ